MNAGVKLLRTALKITGRLIPQLHGAFDLNNEPGVSSWHHALPL